MLVNLREGNSRCYGGLGHALGVYVQRKTSACRETERNQTLGFASSSQPTELLLLNLGMLYQSS